MLVIVEVGVHFTYIWWRSTIETELSSQNWNWIYPVSLSQAPSSPPPYHPEYARHSPGSRRWDEDPPPACCRGEGKCQCCWTHGWCSSSWTQDRERWRTGACREVNCRNRWLPLEKNRMLFIKEVIIELRHEHTVLSKNTSLLIEMLLLISRMCV